MFRRSTLGTTERYALARFTRPIPVARNLLEKAAFLGITRDLGENLAHILGVSRPGPDQKLDRIEFGSSCTGTLQDRRQTATRFLEESCSQIPRSSLRQPVKCKRPTMKCILKRTADVIAILIVLPAFVAYSVARFAFGKNRAFPGWSQVMCLIPGICGAYLRRAFYSLVFRRCDTDSWISFGTVFSHAGCSFGKNVYVGCFCCIGEVTLENDVLVASHVSITNGSAQHGTSRLDIPVREQPGVWPHVTIGQNTWIGDRAVVMANVGKHCIVGAGAVVTNPLPDFAIAVGVPAR